MDIHLTTRLRFLIKMNMASSTLHLPEMNLSQCFFGNSGTYVYCILEWNWRPSIMVGACVKIFLKSLENLDWIKNEILNWSKVFLQILF